MTDKNNTEDNKDNARKTITLKPSSNNTVKQNFSHGRSKAVVVETKRRKFKLSEDKAAPNTTAPATPSPAPSPTPRVSAPKSKASFSNNHLSSKKNANNNNNSRQLSSVELEARKQALNAAKLRAAEQEKQQQIALELEKRRQEELRLAAEAEQARQKAELEAQALAAKALEASQAAANKAQSQSKADANSPSEAQAKVAKKPAEKAQSSSNYKKPAAAPKPVRNASPTAEAEKPASNRRHGFEAENANKRATPKVEAKPAKLSRSEEERRRGKISISSAFDEEEERRGRSIAAMRRRQEKIKRAQQQEVREKISREVIIPETISLQELAQRMAERAVDVIKFLMKQGQMVKPGDILDADMAQLIAEEFGHTVRRVAESDIEEGFFDLQDNPDNFISRAPIVTIMGHVDHGKTSLLDALRKTNVVSGEAGGITQHIGAYQVEKNNKKITFIDTPGHAAFTAMRARGAQVTDIAVLVVAADDSVMPQTIESINHAKAANVPIIVAINKIDKPSADPQKVRTELLQHNVFVESLGGDVLEVEVSAKTGQNLDGLLEVILLQAEMLTLQADPERRAEGTVIEAKLDRGRGPVVTVLVQKGTLKLGDIIVAGHEWGRVRALLNDHGKHCKEATPSMPVEILGMQGTPHAGDKLAVVPSEAKGRAIAEYRQRLMREKTVAKQTVARGSLEQMMNQLQTSGLKEFPLVIKGDVQGSIEAIKSALEKVGNNEIYARIVHSGVGGITESDVTLANTAQAAIIGFNVRCTKQANDAALKQGIEVRYYNIIYDLLDDIKAAMSGLLTPERRETFLGNAEVLETFNVSKVGKVAGCRVTDGKVERGSGVRLVRDNVVIYEGKLKTLKRFKDEVSEVLAGQECGMAFENYEDLRVGDVLEAFSVEHVRRSL